MEKTSTLICRANQWTDLYGRELRYEGVRIIVDLGFIILFNKNLSKQSSTSSDVSSIKFWFQLKSLLSVETSHNVKTLFISF